MRYLPLTPQEEKKILTACAEPSFESLTRDIPEKLRLKNLAIPEALSESEILAHIDELAKKNTANEKLCLIGQGAYDHTWPAVVDYLSTRGEFLTAYTPYQPEVSQGTLQAIFEYQSMIAELFGMEVSNASLYDGSTALVEAVLMAARLQSASSGTVILSEGIYEQSRKVLECYLAPLGFNLLTWNANKNGQLDEKNLPNTNGQNVVAVVAQSPNKWGAIEDWSTLIASAKKLNTKSVAHIAHPHALALTASPGEAGVDVASGEGQSLGIPLGFGGPYLGLFCCSKKDVRQMPGRLVGQTVDSRGRLAFCVTLSTREQHIRREKATSNICSNQSLMALRACMYLSLMGPEGMREVATLSHSAAEYVKAELRKKLRRNDLQLLEAATFNEWSILYTAEAEAKIHKLRERSTENGVLLGHLIAPPAESGYKGALALAFTERVKKDDADRVLKIFEEYL